MRMLTGNIRRKLAGMCGIWLVTISAVASGPANGLFSVPGQRTYLPVDSAFQFSALQNNEQLILRWQIAPGYYLYRDRINVDQAGVAIPLELPVGLEKLDETFGLVQVFYRLLEIEVPINPGLTQVQIDYQGCADAGLCYPPRQQVIALEAP